MNLLFRLAVRVARAVSNFLGHVTEAATTGVLPDQNVHAVHANVEWGRQWLLSAMDATLRGDRVQVTPLDLVMLAIFVASTLMARRLQATRVIVAAWHLASTTS